MHPVPEFRVSQIIINILLIIEHPLIILGVNRLRFILQFRVYIPLVICYFISISCCYQRLGPSMTFFQFLYGLFFYIQYNVDACTFCDLTLLIRINLMVVFHLFAQIFMKQCHNCDVVCFQNKYQFYQTFYNEQEKQDDNIKLTYVYELILGHSQKRIDWHRTNNINQRRSFNFIYLQVLLYRTPYNKFHQGSIAIPMNNDDIFAWIVSKPQNYPGRHLMSQARTFEAVKPLDPKAQFHLIFKGLGEYIKENMAKGKGINYRGFGAFTFQVATDLVKPAQLSNFDITKQLNNQRQQRMHNHKIRPCFVADKQLVQQLIRHPGKQEIEKPKSQHSIYQKGFSMIYCNPVPIANSCYLDKETVQDALNAFGKAVTDLTSLGKSMEINLGILKVKILNRDISYSYNKQFANQLNVTQYEKEMKKSLKQTKSHWTDSYNQKWNQSTLGNLINKPKVEETSQIYEKGLGLKIMSLDFNTTQTVHKNKNVH